MGNISKKLHRKLASKTDNLPTKEPKRRPGEPLPGDIRDVGMLIKDGLDPIHAACAYIQQISSYFAEGMSQLPELKAYAKLAGDAEDGHHLLAAAAGLHVLGGGAGLAQSLCAVVGGDAIR